MTVELSRNRSERQSQQSGTPSVIEPSARPQALAGAEAHLAEARDIRRGIAQAAPGTSGETSPLMVTPEQQAARARLQRNATASDARTHDDFHESMNSRGRRAAREQLEAGRQPTTDTDRMQIAELPQMRSAERAKQPEPSRVEPAAAITKATSVERETRTRPVSQPQPAAAPQPTSRGWFQSAWQETFDAAKGLVAIHKDVNSWLFSKAKDAVVAGYGFAKRVATDPVGVMNDAVEVAKSAGSAVVSAGKWTAGKAKDAFDWVVDNGAAVVTATGKVFSEVGQGIWEGTLAAGNAVVGLGKVITGQMSWAQLSQQLSVDFSKAWSHVSSAAGTVWSGIKMAGGFIADVSNSIGLTDILIGGYRLSMAGPQFMADLTRVALGQATLGDAFSRLGGNLAGAGQAFVGGLKCLGEVTGVTDLCMAGVHSFHGLAAYGRGEKQAATAHFTQAAFHGAFAAMSAGTIAATVATAGAAAPAIAGVVMGRTALKVGAKQVLNVAAKEFFKEGAKAVAKQVEVKIAKEAVGLLSKEAGGQAILKQLTKEATEELGKQASKAKVTELVGHKAMNHLLSSTAVDGAYAGSKALHELMKKEGVQALTKENAHAVHREAIAKPLEELLTGLKFKEHVSDVALDLLHSVRDKSARKAGAELAEALGVSTKEGVEMAKQARRALMKGRSDDAIKEELTEGLTKHFSSRFADQMESAHKGQFRKILNGDLEEPWAKELSEGVEKRAKDLGKQKDELVDDLVDAGWDGAKEGIEKTVRKFAKEGIDDAFKRFRSIKLRPGFGGAEDAPELRAVSEIKGEELAKATATPEGKVAEEARPNMSDMAAMREYSVTEGDEVITVKLAFDNKDNAYHEVGRTRSSLRRDKEKNIKATAA